MRIQDLLVPSCGSSAPQQPQQPVMRASIKVGCIELFFTLGVKSSILRMLILCASSSSDSSGGAISSLQQHRTHHQASAWISWSMNLNTAKEEERTLWTAAQEQVVVTNFRICKWFKVARLVGLSLLALSENYWKAGSIGATYNFDCRGVAQNLFLDLYAGHLTQDHNNTAKNGFPK